MSEQFTPFSNPVHLDTPTGIQSYLKAASDKGDASEYLHALGIAARARGLDEVAKLSGLTRASLSKSLSDDGSPSFVTVYRVSRALGVKLVAQPITA